MNKAGVEINPKVNLLLGKIEAILYNEDPAVVSRMKPMIEDARRMATFPTNPLGYSELATKLMNLAGHLSVDVVFEPRVFVGHKWTDKDDEIANKFMELFELEGLKCLTGKPAKPVDVDEKVKGLINDTDGTIIIFGPDKKLEATEYMTTSGWLKDEKSYAMGKGKPILLFFDNTIHPDEKKGIQGDYEYIDFDKECLAEAILEAIPYLRSFRKGLVERSL